MISVKTFIYNAFQENTFVLSDETGECIIVDPGCSSSFERINLSEYLTSEKLIPKAIVNTHCHVDHVLGCKSLKEMYNLLFYAHENDNFLLSTAVEYGTFFGLQVDQPPLPDYYLIDNQEFRFGNSVLQILFVPGHSPGSIALYSKEDNFVITGDVLFKDSIGRTDLPGGDYDTLIISIRSRLMVLPDLVIVYPGHGPHTTIKHERYSNPFLK